MTSSLVKSIPTVNSISGVAQSLDDVWTDFLKLHISPNTKRTYAAALNDFFTQLTGAIANPHQIQEFLNLSQYQAVGVVLKYKGILLDAGLAPATINTRISAIKSLTNHARKLGQCRFSLEDIPHVRVEKYRDTSGVDAVAYRAMLARVDRTSFKGKRDYAILRLLWDNALRRGELVAANIADFRDGQLWIVGKGKTQLQSIDLAARTVYALQDWLAVRAGTATEPIFIALDGRSYGQRLSGRSVARLVEGIGKDAGITKHLSPHRVRHSAITTFLDASGGDVRTAQRLSRHSRLDTLMIYDDNCYLEVNHYIQPPEGKNIYDFLKKSQTKSLDAVVKIIRLPFKQRIVENIAIENVTEAIEITMSDFPEYGYVRNPSRIIKLEKENKTEYFLEPGDILISVKASSGKVAIVSDMVKDKENRPWIANQSCLVLRCLKNKIDPKLLFMYLTSNIGQYLLRAISSGASIPIIQLARLRELEIIIPTHEEQHKIMANFDRLVELQSQMDSIRQEQERLNNSYWSL